MLNPRKKPPRVLLIEDDDIDAVAVQRAFKRESLEADLVRVRSGEEALALLRAEKPGDDGQAIVTLLDLNMPGMGGHEFLKELRSDEQLMSFVVFVLSTSSDSHDIERAYGKQVAGYFVKSIESGSNREILEALRAYFAVSVLPGDV